MTEANSDSATSASLLMRVRDPNDRESWRTFEQIYGRIVRSYCRHWQLQPSDADDIVQDVLSSVAKQIKDFDYDPAKGRFRAWLGTVAANKIKTFLIRTNKRTIAESPLEWDSTEVNETYTDPDSNWVEVFSNEILKQALENIRPHFESLTWKTFQSSWIEDKPATEVAQLLSIPIHSVYVNKSRVLKRLEREIRMLADDVAYDF